MEHDERYRIVTRLSEMCNDMCRDNDDDIRSVQRYWRGRSESHYLYWCYRVFYIRGVNVFVDFKRFVDTTQATTVEQFASELWRAYGVAATTPRSTKDGNSRSLEELFIALTMRRDRTMTHERAHQLFFIYLASQCMGHVAEWETFNALTDALPDHAVTWASAADESRDVDAYIDDIPVSIKNFNAFSPKSINTYRCKSKKPLLYVNSDLVHYVVTPADTLAQHGASMLSTSVDRLSQCSRQGVASSQSLAIPCQS